MDLIRQYDENSVQGQQAPSPSDDEKSQATTTLSLTKLNVNLAPPVKGDPVDKRNYLDPTQSQVFFNPKYEELFEPVKGPQPPFVSTTIAVGKRNTLTGFVQDENLNDNIFKLQYTSFANKGFAADPTLGRPDMIVGNLINSQIETAKKTQKNKTKDNAKRPFQDPSDTENFLGPWAPHPSEAELTTAPKTETATNGTKTNNMTTGESKTTTKDIVETGTAKKESVDLEKAKEPEGLPRESDETIIEPSTKKRKIEEIEAQGVFHGDIEIDYQGRSWIEPPSYIKPYKGGVADFKCYLPKKRIHTWSGHSKGVAAIRFFPQYCHLLLSASMDTTVKIWDVHNQRKCLMTYYGHRQAVRDICFNYDGRRFLSCSYDRIVRLWDTETGQCIKTLSTGKIPYCVKFPPNPEQQNAILVGQSDKKIIQWDLNSNEITQEYDRHLGPVNTITFIDEGRRFVTTSDDKSIRIWEFGIPVDCKYIAEPHMHSMPAVCPHPNGKWLLMQSLDNQILVYSTRDRFRLNRKKRFHGHINGGYACEISVSPDGQYVISGDSEGRVWFWSWKTCKVFKKLICHTQVSIGCVWNPTETSKIATCSWDGTIKYWD